MKKLKITPYVYIMLSFLLVIIIGTLLLCLPFSTNDGKGLGLIDSLFMTVTSVCVTGLSVIPNVGETMSIFGKIVLLVLIEIGGLSFLTIAVFFILLLGKQIGVAGTLLMREALNQKSASGIGRLVKRIILLAAIIQGIGIICCLPVFISYYGNVWKGIGVSIFHSVSSFNNAGIDIFGYDNSMINFRSNTYLNIITMLLIFFGGVGFIVIYDVIKNKNPKNYSIHTKIVLIMSISLIVIGALLIKFSMKDINLLDAFFCSVTARTAGFATIDMATLTKPAYIVMVFLMFTGASPCSTGGGVKTTTLFIVIVAILSLARGKNPVAFKRKIADESILKAFALVTIAILYIIFILFFICLIEKSFTFDQILFEVVSAFGTVGLTQGITPSVTSGTKLLLSLTMFFGRLGPLTIISTLNNNWLKNTKESVKYVEEKIIIG